MFNLSKRSGLSLFFMLFLLVGYISAMPVKGKGKGLAAKGKAPARGKPVVAQRKATKQSKAGAVGASCPMRKRLGKRAPTGTLIGYKGVRNGPVTDPKTSGGGELGDVLYVADAVDLARQFAKGTDPKKEYICKVYVDSSAWLQVPKAWVNPSGGSKAMDCKLPGCVLFSSHTNAGLEPGSIQNVYQLGIRKAQIDRLKVQFDCAPKECFMGDHSTLNYPGLKSTWSIQDA